MPSMKSDSDLKRGEYDYKVSNENISIVKWKDKKSVHMLSTLHDPKEVTSVNRRQKDGNLIEVQCPQVLKDYNLNMNFVDNFDRIVNDYHLGRKSKRCWLRIFFHMLHCSVSNAFICHKELEMDKFSNKNFIRSVYEGLLKKSIVETTPNHLKQTKLQFTSMTKKARISEQIRFEQSEHQPERTGSRRCAVCSTKMKPVRTVWSCSTCKVGLCIKHDKLCFSKFHNSRSST